MKIYKLPELADANPEGAYFLGDEDLKSNAAYIFYRSLRSKEAGCELFPKEGYEEIVYVIKGSLAVRCGKSSFPVGAGEAFLLKGKLVIGNPHDDPAVFLAVGGRPGHVKPQPVKTDAVKDASSSAATAEETNIVRHEQDEKGKAEDAGNDFEITTEDAPIKGEGEGEP